MTRNMVAIATMALVLAGCSPEAPTHQAHVSPTPATTGAPFPPPGSGPLPTATATALQAVLDDVVFQWGVSHQEGGPGITAAVVSDRGSWAGAAGIDGSGAHLTPNAVMGIASITKTFLASEVMKLAGEGRLRLDAPLSTYVADPAAGNGATVREALGMRSGIVDPPKAATDAFFYALPLHPDRHWSIADTLRAMPPQHSTRGSVAYSNANYELLGLAVQKVTGQTVAELEQSDFFGPAGLTRIAAQDSHRAPTPIAAAPRRLHVRPDGYAPFRGDASVFQDTAAGLAADAPTVARWAYLLYGGRILAPATVAAMTTPTSAEEVFPGVGYGLGTMLFSTLGTERAVGHIGSDIAYSSMVAVVPSRHLAVSFLIPEDTNQVQEIMRPLIQAATT
jgi:CubicO group peptidase (beta-lactamase class C family)